MCICKGCHVLEKVRAVDNAKFETTNEGSPTGRDKRRFAYRAGQTSKETNNHNFTCHGEQVLSRDCLQVFIPCHSW